MMQLHHTAITDMSCNRDMRSDSRLIGGMIRNSAKSVSGR
jgi:hypothetical protein